jgi:hypothetical protein
MTNASNILYFTTVSLDNMTNTSNILYFTTESLDNILLWLNIEKNWRAQKPEFYKIELAVFD